MPRIPLFILRTSQICSTTRLQTADQPLSRGRHCKSWRSAVYHRCIFSIARIRSRVNSCVDCKCLIIHLPAGQDSTKKHAARCRKSRTAPKRCPLHKWESKKSQAERLSPFRQQDNPCRPGNDASRPPYSNRFVVMKSTPHAASRSASALSSQVQQFTRIPSPCSSSTISFVRAL